MRVPALTGMGFRPLRHDEAADAARRSAVSFGGSLDEEAVEEWRSRIAGGDVWGLADDADRILAHGRFALVDHWLGGRRVPTQHVAALAVPPEHRAKGVAAALMRAAVAEGTRQGAGLSLLFPATVALYRRLGYEHAGTFTRYRLDARRAPSTGPPLRPAEGEEDWKAIRRCGDLAASLQHGPAVRPDHVWRKLRTAAYHYVLDGVDAEPAEPVLDAYVLFDHHHEPGDWQYTLDVDDWAATTARGLAAVVGLVGRHGTIGKAATFRGPVPDQWSMLVAEQDVAAGGGFWWMARGLDLAVAIAARGFPPGLTGAATVTVEDPLLPEARGRWRLEVADGGGVLEPAGRAAGEGAGVHLDARAVGPLVTGFRTPRQLALAGLADGPAEALDWLAGAFAGPVPVLLDFF